MCIRDRVQPCGEVLAMGEHQGAARLVVTLVLAQRRDQVVEHRLVDGVALGGAVQSEHQDVAAFLTAYAARGGLGHGLGPLAWEGRGHGGYSRSAGPCPRGNDRPAALMTNV